MNEIYLASGNVHKKQEFQNFFPKIKVKIPSDEKINFDPVEDGKTFLENAMIKARALYEIVKKPVFADDSGLCVLALNNEPGIYSSRYAGVHSDDESQDKKNNEKLLTQLLNVENRSAAFVCCLVLYLNPLKFFVVQETCEGKILYEPKGKNGFGYDPIFFIPSLNKTMAELSPSQKNLYSHRAKALQKIQRFLD